MSWSPGVGVDAVIGITVGYKESVDLSARRADGVADLIIGREIATIHLELCHLETIRDQLPGVLADLGVLEAADERAAEAGSRAVELAAYLTDAAVAAERAGEHERAGELRGTADKLTASSDALEKALEAVQQAAHAADNAAEDAKWILDKPVAEDQQRAQDQPADDQPAGEA